MTGVKLEIPAEEMETAPREEGEAEDGQHSNEDLVYTPYLPERADLPAKKVRCFSTWGCYLRFLRRYWSSWISE
jgi:hypothetical protein